MYNRSDDQRDDHNKEKVRDREDRDRDYRSSSGSSKDNDGRSGRNYGSRDDYHRSNHGKSRSRWDNRDSRELEGDRGGSSRSTSRWDRGRDEGTEKSSVRSNSRWDNNEERLSSNANRTTVETRRRSRSRSSSPFRRSDRDYSSYSNPSREDSEGGGGLRKDKDTGGIVNRKLGPSEWSDSSDDGDSVKRKDLRDNKEVRNSSRFGQQHLNYSSRQAPPLTKPVYQNPYPPNYSGTSGPAGGLSLKIESQAKPGIPLPKILSVSRPIKSTNVASIFNDDDDDEEEMPAECKMRMKNVGRETKTSEGPNSFGKTKIGFCNKRHLDDKKL